MSHHHLYKILAELNEGSPLEPITEQNLHSEFGIAPADLVALPDEWIFKDDASYDPHVFPARVGLGVTYGQYTVYIGGNDGNDSPGRAVFVWQLRNGQKS